LTFFGNRICPFSHRGYWALAEKEALDIVDYVHVDLNAAKPAWFKVCPHVPVLPLASDVRNGRDIDSCARCRACL
jgi:hypothetical protein